MFLIRGHLKYFASPAAKEDTDYGEAWLELEQLHKRVAELESQLGIATREGGTRKPQGLNFKVHYQVLSVVKAFLVVKYYNLPPTYYMQLCSQAHVCVSLNYV